MDAPIFEQEVKKRTKKIETMLISKFGASGRGLWEKLTSVESHIPPATVKKIKFLATVRNKLEHVDGYVFDGSQEQFLRTGDECIAVLETTEQRVNIPDFPNPLLKLTHYYDEIEYTDGEQPQGRDLKTSLKNFNFSGQPKALRIAAYAVGVIIACNIVIQLGAFAGRSYSAQPAGSEPAATAAPTPDAPKSADVPAKKIDDYAGTYGDSGICPYEFYTVNKRYFLKEKDGCGGQVYELLAASPTSFRFAKAAPYEAPDSTSTLDFIVKNGKTTGFQMTGKAKSKFWQKEK